MFQAKLYAHANELQRSDARKVLDEFGPLINWNGHDTLLDIGCGSGDVTIDLVLPKMPRNYQKVVGMDISEKMVTFARERFCNKFMDLQFVQGDIGGEMKQFSKYLGEFDHITSFFCLHWVQNQRRAFSNICQLLKPGGDCLVSMLAQIPLFDAYELMSQSSKWMKYMQDVNEFVSPYQKAEDPGALAETFLKSFHGSYKVHVRERVFVYNDVNALRASMKAVNPFVNRVPFEERENFISDLVQHVTDMGLHREGAFVSPYKVLVIFAVKQK